MTRPNILLVSAGRRTTMCDIFKSAGAQVYAYELEDDCPIAKSAKQVFIANKFRPSNHKQDIHELNEVCKKADIQLVIPFSCEAAAWLYNYETSLVAPCLTSFGSRICYDKECFAQWFKGKSLFDFYPWAEHGEYAVFKPTGGCGGEGVYYEQYWSECPEEYVAQRNLKEPEYSADCYFDRNGNFVAGSVREREFIAAGEVLESIVVDRPDIIDIVKRVGEVISFRGPICAQFMGSPKNPKITEINARFGGGCPLSIYAGLNMVEWVMREYIDNKDLPIYAYESKPRIGAKTRRYYKDCFFN